MTAATQSKPADQRKRGSRTAILLLALLGLWLGYQLLQSPLLPAGTEAPPWRLPRANFGGNALANEAFRGDVVVLDFWSTTCPPCIRQFDELEAVWRRMKARGVTIIGIAAGGETVAEIKAFLKQRPLDYPVVVDSGITAGAYQVTALPALYIIDRQGKVAASHMGFWDQESIAKAINRVLETN